MLQPMRLFVLLSLSVVLASCGFTLRGGQQTSLAVTSLHLQSTQDSAPLTQQLRDALTAANVVMTTSADRASHILSVGEEQTSTRTASVNSRARAAQYDLQLAVLVQLDSHDATLFGPETIVVQRSYYEDIANIAGSNEELALLQTEMRQELVEQLLRRLSAAINSSAQ